MRGTLNMIKKLIKVLISISIFTLLAIIIIFLIQLIPIIMLESVTDRQRVPTDAEMIEHFKLHENYFEKLRLMMENDGLWNYPLSIHEKNSGIILPITADRQEEYDSLMQKIQIVRLDRGKVVRIIKGDATWEVIKGYEYISDKKYSVRKYIEEELYSSVRQCEYDDCLLYKKINDRWDLFIFYDK